MRQLVLKVCFAINQVPLYLWQIKPTEKMWYCFIKLFSRLLLHKNNAGNYLTTFQFMGALIIMKLQSYFLKCAWCDAYQGSSGFLFALNYCRFYLMQLWLQFLFKNDLKGVFLYWENKRKSKVLISTDT